MRTLVWFRGKDLRLSDHAPLRAAIADGDVIPLFVLDPYFFAPARAQNIPHRMQFLLESLESLAANIRARGSRLIVVAGKSIEVVPALAKDWRVDRVVAQRWTEPFGRDRDERITAQLHVPFTLFDGETLAPPESLRTGAGEPYSVFTPFARAFLARSSVVDVPLPAPRTLPPLPADVHANEVSVPTCAELGITRNVSVLSGGERAARDRLKRFVTGPLGNYGELRDRMDREGTSRLSVDLKFGTLSPRTVWHAVAEESATFTASSVRSFQNELIWREFTHASLWDRPTLLTEPFRPAWNGFPWRNDETEWQAWVEGRTGYPIVDAAARELLTTGFVHNRARMISASFLTKHLLIDYRRGEAHYLRYLTDGDYAQNNAGWQWSAGCGCDAQPYFRIFNPESQGKKFDPQGDYVRRHVPELRHIPSLFVHAPWSAPEAARNQMSASLATYVRPIVDHKFARERFLKVARAHLESSRVPGIK